jgi:hypothetical protein
VWQRTALVLGIASFLAADSLSLSVTAAQDSQLREQSRKNWMDAPHSGGPRWNRQKLLQDIMKDVKIYGLTRSDILKMLGAPGFASEDFPGNVRIDEWRLSAENTSVFRVDYDSDARVTDSVVDGESCACPACSVAASAISEIDLKRTGLLDLTKASEFNSLTVSELDRKLGKPGSVEISQSTAGGQVWQNYSDTWRLKDLANGFFIADGHQPFRDSLESGVGNRRIESWSLVTYAPDCLAQ